MSLTAQRNTDKQKGFGLSSSRPGLQIFECDNSLSASKDKGAEKLFHTHPYHGTAGSRRAIDIQSRQFGSVFDGLRLFSMSCTHRLFFLRMYILLVWSFNISIHSRHSVLRMSRGFCVLLSIVLLLIRNANAGQPYFPLDLKIQAPSLPPRTCFIKSVTYPSHSERETKNLVTESFRTRKTSFYSLYPTERIIHGSSSLYGAIHVLSTWQLGLSSFVYCSFLFFREHSKLDPINSQERDRVLGLLNKVNRPTFSPNSSV